MLEKCALVHTFKTWENVDAITLHAAETMLSSCSPINPRDSPLFFIEIPEFLSEDECRVVMQLAQLKGLMESQLMVQDGQEELAKELNLSPEEIFSLLDINQDGQLQLYEVHVRFWTVITWFRFRTDSSHFSHHPSNRYWRILEWGTVSGSHQRICKKSILGSKPTKTAMVRFA